MTTYALPAYVQRFFADRLIAQQGASPHTVASYRDTFRLLLNYTCEQVGREPTDLLVTDIDADLVARFLCFIEDSRQNSPRTRNARRSTIRAFFRFVAVREPALLYHCQQVLAIPAKRHDKRMIDYLDRGECAALLAAPDLSTWIGRRDRTLLLVALQTVSGCRNRSVSMLATWSLSPSPKHTCIAGKGPQGAGDAVARRQCAGAARLAGRNGRSAGPAAVREYPPGTLQSRRNRAHCAQIRPDGIRDLPRH